VTSGRIPRSRPRSRSTSSCSHTPLGQGAFQAADERAIATVIGIVIAALSFVLLRDIALDRDRG
jgi:hypothetical protein